MAGSYRSPHRAGITQDMLKECYDYDPVSGHLFYKIAHPHARVGARAGAFRKGWWVICIDGFLFQASNVVWLYCHGYWPEEEVDHKDRNKLNDAIDNLRLATRSQNEGNKGRRKDNSSGFRGVTEHPQRRHSRWRWWASIKVNKYRYDLGVYPEPWMAAAAYRIASAGMRGEFRGVS